MVKRDEILKFLNKELNVKKIKDSSRNGLQIKGEKEVRKIGFAVDACIETFEKAKKKDCDMIIVHHGLKWVPQKYREITRLREDYLKRNKISLYAAHLPLDLHKKYGNNIELCKILKLSNIKKFGKYHGIYIGFKGEFKSKVSMKEIARILDKKINAHSHIYSFKEKKIKSIGIISGGGSDAIEDAVNEKLDCFLTGEVNLASYKRAKDFKQNMIVCGHYATETLGVKALMPLLSRKFKVKTVFIDVPIRL